MKKLIVLILTLILVPIAYGGPTISGGGGGTPATQASLHIDDILTALGIASEAATMPNGTGSVWPDGSTQAAINQALETAVEGKAATAGSTSLVTYGPTALQAVTCTDSGDGSAGALTITPTAGLGISNISLTVNDAHGCTITMSEVGQVEGQIAIIRNISAANTATFTTSAGVLTLKHGSPYMQAADETIWLQYQGSRWLEIGRQSATLGVSVFNAPSDNTGATAATVGNLVHHADSTASNAGGALELGDGTQVQTFVTTGTNYTIITKTEFLPIGWAVDGATAPSAIADVTGKEVKARSFSEGDDVVFWWVVPNDYVGGVKYRVHYALAANANADDTAVFSMAGSIIANSGDPDGSAGTALTISDELGTDDDQYQYMVTDYSAESNADWLLAAGALARLNFSHAAASDMVGAGEPLVIGIEIKYKAKIIGIAGY